MSNNAKKKVVLVEDDPEAKKIIRETLLPYSQDIDLLEATNAGAAMNLVFPDPPGNRPDALILDLMIPYGEAAQKLDAESDPDWIETGVRLLDYLRKREKTELGTDIAFPLWVAVITARSNPLLIQSIEKLLAGSGRIYLKPFNDLELEHDLACILHIKSQVDPILLSPEYSPPKRSSGGAR
ncbi:MAG: hypothetical protein U9N47_07900 [Thermodesulfobacteriota bacterium]|nr:hypothetical protein [Thermodesulfobacteriota bacterium]